MQGCSVEISFNFGDYFTYQMPVFHILSFYCGLLIEPQMSVLLFQDIISLKRKTNSNKSSFLIICVLFIIKIIFLNLHGIYCNSFVSSTIMDINPYCMYIGSDTAFSICSHYKVSLNVPPTVPSNWLHLKHISLSTEKAAVSGNGTGAT